MSTNDSLFKKFDDRKASEKAKAEAKLNVEAEWLEKTVIRAIRQR